jgi:translation initiation factor 3 subunit A
MTNRRTLKFSIFAASVLALALPVAASAQWDSRDRYPDNRGYGRYDDRGLRDSVHRLDKLAKDFERDMDRALDRSRANGSRREDQINNEIHQFRDAVGDLKSRVGNGRDLNRSSDEARRVLQEAQQVDRIARPRWYDNRLASEWSQIQQELRYISNVYGFRYNGSYGRDDDYRRNDDYRRDRNNRNRNNDDWWRRIPFPQ